jgi:hypothetical protein
LPAKFEQCGIRRRQPPSIGKGVGVLFSVTSTVALLVLAPHTPSFAGQVIADRWVIDSTSVTHANVAMAAGSPDALVIGNSRVLPVWRCCLDIVPRYCT